MEDSSSSSSYSFSDTSIDNENNPICTCTLTKITYNAETYQTVNTTPTLAVEHPAKHMNLDRSKSEPVIRLSDREDESLGLEPNCDLFGIQLEVNLLLALHFIVSFQLNFGVFCFGWISLIFVYNTCVLNLKYKYL